MQIPLHYAAGGWGAAPSTRENNVQDLGACKSIKFRLMMSLRSLGCKCQAENRFPALYLSIPKPLRVLKVPITAALHVPTDTQRRRRVWTRRAPL